MSILIIDAQKGLTDQDKKIAAVSVSSFKPLILAINKWDLIKDITWSAYLDKVRYDFPHINHVPIIAVSCKTGKNIKSLIDHIIKLINASSQLFSTPELNKIIQNLVKKIPPQKGSKGEVKFFYILQTGIDCLSHLQVSQVPSPRTAQMHCLMTMCRL